MGINSVRTFVICISFTKYCYDEMQNVAVERVR